MSCWGLTFGQFCLGLQPFEGATILEIELLDKFAGGSEDNDGAGNRSRKHEILYPAQANRVVSDELAWNCGLLLFPSNFTTITLLDSRLNTVWTWCEPEILV